MSNYRDPVSRPTPRSDLEGVLREQEARLDPAREGAVHRQAERGLSTARANIDALIDRGSFVEYGGLARPVHPEMDGPADGLVMGTAQVDGHGVVVMAYDFTVYGGTQSATNHRKMSRMFSLAERNRWPVVGWWDGGGARTHDLVVPGRPESDGFVTFARLSGLVPTVAVVTGRAFAGQANLTGLCDFSVATRRAAMGMAGPPLVESALGIRYRPEEIGPMTVHEAAGAVDLVVDTEGQAIESARAYLRYFRGPRTAGAAPDTFALRDVVPENPRRAYNVRKVVEGICDEGDWLELRPKFGRAAVTGLGRIGGYPVAIIGNQPMHLAGAMDSDACDKIARFIGLADAYDLPLVFLVDTPGLMVGPEVEKTALVRHSARILTAAANATVPFMTVVLRKAYGLGYYVLGALAYEPDLLVAWPTAEFGGMGLEGAASILYKEELKAAPDEDARRALHHERTMALRAAHTPLGVAGRFHIDDVIDPADTRAKLLATLQAIPVPPARKHRKRTVEPW
ncbi:MAG: carboxyl transferase domain-containing protein [Pseudomonadota bacterium]